MDTAILDSAARSVVDVGADRITIAEIARRAGVSRPTVYRRWSGVDALLAALLSREILRIAADTTARVPGREELVDLIVTLARRVGQHEVFDALLHSESDIFRTYVLTRLGSSQRTLIDVLTTHITHVQKGATVRAGDPRRMAAMVLLITQSAIQSAHAVASILDDTDLFAELTRALNGYLAP